IGAEKFENIGAKNAIVLWHDLVGLAAEERRLYRNLRLHIARQELLEFNEAIDKTERDLRAKHRVFAPTNACVAFKDRIARLLNGEGHDLADIGNVLGRLSTDDRHSAETDVVQLMKCGSNPHARR